MKKTTKKKPIAKPKTVVKEIKELDDDELEKVTGGLTIQGIGGLPGLNLPKIGIPKGMRYGG